MKKTVSIGIACLLAGVLAGYLSWGPGSGRLTQELAEVKARQEGERKELEARLKQALEELELERKQRAKLELLLGEGRK